MKTGKGRSKIALPPVALNSPGMMEIISKGGTVSSQPLAATVPAVVEEPGENEDKLKSFTFKIYESELAQIREIQARLPKRDRISIHDFVVAAVKEKISRESKKQLLKQLD